MRGLRASAVAALTLPPPATAEKFCTMCTSGGSHCCCSAHSALQRFAYMVSSFNGCAMAVLAAATRRICMYQQQVGAQSSCETRILKETWTSGLGKKSGNEGDAPHQMHQLLLGRRPPFLCPPAPPLHCNTQLTSSCS